MSFIAKLRNLRWTPRVALALFVLAISEMTLLPCAMATSATDAAPHCIHCLPASGAGGCVMVHAANDAQATNIASWLPTFDRLPLQFVFNMPAAVSGQPFTRTELIPPPPTRPLHLTHCVQLK